MVEEVLRGWGLGFIGFRVYGDVGLRAAEANPGRKQAACLQVATRDIPQRVLPQAHGLEATSLSRAEK